MKRRYYEKNRNETKRNEREKEFEDLFQQFKKKHGDYYSGPH